MERLLNALEMKAVDDYTINNLGFSSQMLIERAGTAVAMEIVKRFKGGRVLCCVGKGNNGEDGKVIARCLSDIHGFSVSTLNIRNGIFRLLDKEYDIIVDCIFGTGLNRQIEGKYKEAIEKINSKNAYIVSCDIPSGLNATTGEIFGACVRANLTVAIQELKLGFYLNDGVDYTGEVVKKDIGMSVWGDDYVKRLNDNDAKSFFEERKRNVHKGSFGKAMVMGGSKQYSGSIMLSANALASLKMGCGYSTVVVPDCLFSSFCGVNPEIILTPLADDGNGFTYDQNSLKTFLNNNSIALGMGMGVTENTYNIVKFFLDNFTGTLILDADALNSISKFGVDVLQDKKCNVVLTPHIQEFSRLLNIKKELIMSDIITLSKEFASKFGIVLLVKSATSVITDGEETFVNTTGCSGMAKCGSGDVLSGLISGITARGFDVLHSVAVSSYLFGRAGELAQESLTEFVMTASNIINYLPKAIKSFG